MGIFRILQSKGIAISFHLVTVGNETEQSFWKHYKTLTFAQNVASADACCPRGGVRR